MATTKNAGCAAIVRDSKWGEDGVGAIRAERLDRLVRVAAQVLEDMVAAGMCC